MSKTTKLVSGVILLGASIFCLLIICVNILRIRGNARKAAFEAAIGEMIAVESIESENLGRTVVTDWGETLTTESSEYEFYRLDIGIKNKGHSLLYANPASVFTIYGVSSEDVGRIVYQEMGELHSEVTIPIIPGKTSTTAILYVEVHTGVHALDAAFKPAWNKDEESLNIILD